MLQPKFDICPWRNYFFSLFSMCNSGHTIIPINYFPMVPFHSLWKSINMAIFSQIYEHLHDSQLCTLLFCLFFFLKCFVSKTHRVLWMMQPEKKPKGWVGKCNNVWCRQRDEKGDVTEERRMAGDTWIKTRSERILRQRQTNTQHEHTHSQWPPSNCRTLDTNTHSCQGQTKIIHKTPTPPPLGVTDTVSPSCTHTRMELPGGSMLSMWPVENHYSAVQTKEPRVNFLFECSGFLFSMAPTPTERSPNSSWKLFCMFS